MSNLKPFGNLLTNKEYKMNDEFVFDDDTNDILSNKKMSKKLGRSMKEGTPKKYPVTCYLTEEEHNAFMAFLEERSVSLYLRKMILKEIGR